MAKNVVDIRYVEPHGKAFRYRRIVPKDVRPRLATPKSPKGPARWTQTFPARTPIGVIEAKARRLSAEHDKLIERARAGETLSPEAIAEAEEQARQWLRRGKPDTYDVLAYIAADPTPTDRVFINALEHGGRYVPEGLSFSATYARDRELYGGERNEKAFPYAVDSFVAVVGSKPVNEISRADVAEWIAKATASGLAPGTIKRRLGALMGITTRAFLDFEINTRNPFEKHAIRGATSRADDRLPFNRKMLERIDSYLATNKRVKHETRNVLRMMKCTGAAVSEIGGLVMADVSLDGEIPFIWIRPNNVRRRLKTNARPRRVPLVAEALEAAKDAVDRAKTGKPRRANPDDVKLFATYGQNDRGADSIGIKINLAIRNAGVPNSPRLTSHSFRHTVKEAMRSAGVRDHVQRRIEGHAGEGVADRYGSPAGRLQEAKEALKAAMQHLGDVDDSIYSAKERLKG